MTKLTTFLSFNGQAEEAIMFYQRMLDAKLVFKVTNQAIQANLDPTYTFLEAEKDWISHSVLKIGNIELSIVDMALDGEKKVQMGNNFAFCLYSKSLEELTNLYKRILSDERTEVITPLGKNFFSEAYGIVKDPFGVIIQYVLEK